jgi:hypothetical protein
LTIFHQRVRINGFDSGGTAAGVANGYGQDGRSYAADELSDSWDAGPGTVSSTAEGKPAHIVNMTHFRN